MFFRVSWLVDWIWRRSSHGYFFALLCFASLLEGKQRGEGNRKQFLGFLGVGLGWVGLGRWRVV